MCFSWVRVWGLCAFPRLGLGDILVFLDKGLGLVVFLGYCLGTLWFSWVRVWGLCGFPGLGFGDFVVFLG